MLGANRLQKLFMAVLIVLLSQAPDTPGQTKQDPAKTEQGEDVVRVNTELVQTDVMVFDKRNHFVEGLRREDFDLRIYGKSQPISFFARVAAGPRSGGTQPARSRGGCASETEGRRPAS